MKRHATAVWQGTGKEGKGHLSTKSGVLKETQYSFSSRFEEGEGTNPEELIAAAHSGCFAMKLSFNLQAENFTAERLEANCTITLKDGSITNSDIVLKAQVPGIDEKTFDRLVKHAEENCPVSKLLSAEISVSYELNK